MIILRVISTGSSHDETQYAAAAYLSGKAIIFRDFLSLQPPLHAWLYAPLCWIFPGDSLIAMRILTMLTACVAIWAVYRAARVLDAPPRTALVSAALMASCHTFVALSSVIRNDMLPLMFFALGTWAFLAAIRAPASPRAPLFVAGILLGLAASTKLSYTPALLTAGLISLAVAPASFRGMLERGVIFAAGGVIGVMPLLVAFMIAPGNFLWGVVTFGATAPYAWYEAIGHGDYLGSGRKVLMLGRFFLFGPASITVLVVARDLTNARGGRRDRLVLAGLALAGLIGGLLPTPAHAQYFLPVLPPLFILLALALAARPPGVLTGTALAGTCLLGVAPIILRGVPAVRNGVPMLIVDRSASWIGHRLDSLDARGTIVTLSPDRILDSGHPIDRRVATGPFVFRSGAMISGGQARTLNVIVPASLEKELDEAPPAAILTGYEHSTPTVQAVDAPLARYAIARGYRRYDVPDGRGRLYVNMRQISLREATPHKRVTARS